MFRIVQAIGTALSVFAVALADGPNDNLPDKVRPIPPPGIKITPADRAELEHGAGELREQIAQLRAALRSKPALLELLPDVEIYHRAVVMALRDNSFFNPREIAAARRLLRDGHERGRLLLAGTPTWVAATGLVARGYVSRIDGSVQPYGLVVPTTYHRDTPHAHRLDIWFHGRGETLTELNFIDQRQRQAGEFTPANAFVLHPYGRYCNANRFAGEIDVFEALEHVRKHYPIDENRILVRGFSMGGAACWQFAVHDAGRWAAAAPGAGFSETAQFLNLFQGERLAPAWYEQKLWHWYDSIDYAINLFNCPTVAYSGEIDRQKQAADAMAKALAAEGINMVHIIGPQTAHRYHPQAKVEIDRRLDAIAQVGRNPLPRHVRFTTWTLRYNQMNWVVIDGLQQHWERARVEAALTGETSVQLTTRNVTGLSLSMPPGRCPLDNTQRPSVLIDGQKLVAAPVGSDRSWQAHFRRIDSKWESVPNVAMPGLQKRHGLQGPIDDAFMDRFLFVRPTGTPLHPRANQWALGELTRAIDHWRLQFRGDAPVKDDAQVTPADIADSNLVLWGDPGSNHLLARIADRLPIRWDQTAVQLGSQHFAPEAHAPIFVYPNPLNPSRYVVLNSGFTYREYDYLNNARQTPKLPDYAVIDLTVPPSTRAPGKVVAAGFFDEHWQLPAAPIERP